VQGITEALLVSQLQLFTEGRLEGREFPLGPDMALMEEAGLHLTPTSFPMVVDISQTEALKLSQISSAAELDQA
jgi:hypothetical protein